MQASSAPQHRYVALIAAVTLSIIAPALTAQTLTVPTHPAKSSTPAAPPNPDAQVDRQAEAKVIASLEARNFTDALTGANAILTSTPDSPKANKLVGVVLLDEQKPSAALPYFDKALKFSPDDPTVHGLLLQAYAQSGDKVRRDQQIAIIRGYHSDGKHPQFAQIPSFLIETIPIGEKTVQSTEFYEPSGEFHFYYRFNIFNSNNQLLSFIALESDDADQALFAQQHPKEAAAGQRRFSLDGYSKSADGKVNQALYTFFNGQPSYDDVRALVIKLVQSENSATPASPQHS